MKKILLFTILVSFASMGFAQLDGYDFDFTGEYNWATWGDLTLDLDPDDDDGDALLITYVPSNGWDLGIRHDFSETVDFVPDSIGVLIKHEYDVISFDVKIADADDSNGDYDYYSSFKIPDTDGEYKFFRIPINQTSEGGMELDYEMITSMLIFLDPQSGTEESRSFSLKHIGFGSKNKCKTCIVEDPVNISLESINSTKDVLVYPTVSDGLINLSKELNNIEIYNLHGELVYKSAAQNQKIDVGFLPASLYILKGNFNNTVVSSKFIIK